MSDDDVLDPDALLIKRINDLRAAFVESHEQWEEERRLLAAQQFRSWRWIKSGSKIIIFDLIVTFAGLYLGVNLYTVQRENDRLIAQVQSVAKQNQTYIHDSCNLYRFIINSYGTAARNRYAAGPVVYDTFIKTVQRSADDLKCGIPHKVS